MTRIFNRLKRSTKERALESAIETLSPGLKSDAWGGCFTSEAKHAESYKNPRRSANLWGAGYDVRLIRQKLCGDVTEEDFRSHAHRHPAGIIGEPDLQLFHF